MKQFKTHVGKVKSHTDIEYNEAADKAARAVVDGEASLDITFDEADPPVGGLKTWPQIRSPTPNKPYTIIKPTNIKTGIKTAIKETTYSTTKGILAIYKKRQERRAQTSTYKRTHNPHTDVEETHMR